MNKDTAIQQAILNVGQGVTVGDCMGLTAGLKTRHQDLVYGNFETSCSGRANSWLVPGALQIIEIEFDEEAYSQNLEEAE